MQWLIIYEVEGTKETCCPDKVKGKLWLPESRTPQEVADAVKTIIKAHNPKEIRIRSFA